MHQVLAIAALHLSTLRPAQREYYRDYATGLQSQALSLFNQTRMGVDASTCVPMFLFSSFIIVHVLCDTLRYHADDLNSVLDRFTHYLELSRGVRAITSRSWPLLRESELKPLLEAFDSPPGASDEAERNEGGDACDTLTAMIEASAPDLGPKSIAAYRETIKHLRWTFGSLDRPFVSERKMHMFNAWPVLVPAEYTDLLAQRRPEAMIILAYYAGLLHLYRHSWIVGDGGRFLIQAITRHLGSHWQTWLAWPNSVLRQPEETGDAASAHASS